MARDDEDRQLGIGSRISGPDDDSESSEMSEPSESSEREELSESKNMSERSETSEGSNTSERSERSKMSERSEASETEKRSETEEVPVKERPNINMYIPGDLKQDLTYTYDEVSLRLGRERDLDVGKNRDYYPAVLRLGLEALGDPREEDLDELAEKLGFD